MNIKCDLAPIYKTIKIPVDCFARNPSRLHYHLYPYWEYPVQKLLSLYHPILFKFYSMANMYLGKEVEWVGVGPTRRCSLGWSLD